LNWKPRNNELRFNKGEDIIDSLLKIRGVKDKENFLNPQQSELHDPYLMKNMKEASEVIIEAIKRNKKIAISADCDTDGISSLALMTRYISKLTNNFYVTFNQRSEGHGIENQMDMIEDDTDLILILDSSTNSNRACDTLHSKGIQMIILDHHDFEKKNEHPIIVNPKLDDTYPNKGLSGAGVVYKMLQTLDNTFGLGCVEDYLDIVAVGMVGDMMPVDVLENRYMIIQGMRNIVNPGIRAILEVNGVKEENINSQTIGYTISPLINGASRMDRIELAIDLLLCDDFDQCLSIALDMKELNEKRRTIEKELFERYSSKINDEEKVIIVTDEEASKNFNGLIANKIAQAYKRPAIVMRSHLGTLAGSFRNYAGFPMNSFLNQPDVKKFINYAVGHEFAGGIGLRESNLKFLKRIIDKKLSNVDFDNSVIYDIELDAKEVNCDMIREIEEFDFLTGTGFPSANFLIKNLFVEQEVKVMGKNRDTIKIICDGVDIIKFRVNEEWASEVEEMDTIEVIGQLKINEYTNWNKVTTITPQIFAELYKVN
jgi:single-stranded-DNA-specific exonuclease